MKKNILISLLAVIMVVMALVSCEKTEPETPPQATQTPSSSRLPEDTTVSPQNEDPDIIKGHVVALLGDCLGNMMVISVENDTAIGTNHDMYGNDYYCDCNSYCDTLFAYENVIGVPLHIDCYNHQPGCLYRYVFNGDTLKTIAVNDYFEFKCQPVDMDTEYSLLFPRGICPAIYNMQEPTNMNLFKITEKKKIH